LTGITARQLKWWDKRGLAVRAHKLHWRICSSEDLPEVELMRRVRRRLEKVFRRRLAETVNASPNYLLLTGGRALDPGNSARRDRRKEKFAAASVCPMPEREVHTVRSGGKSRPPVVQRKRLPGPGETGLCGEIALRRL